MAPAQARAVHAAAGQLADVRTGRRRRRLRRQHRLPVAAPRREHPARQLPAFAVHAHTRLTRVRSRRPTDSAPRSHARHDVCPRPPATLCDRLRRRRRDSPTNPTATSPIPDVRHAFLHAVADAARSRRIERLDSTDAGRRRWSQPPHGDRIAPITPVDERRRWLLDAAELMSAERAPTIGLMAHTRRQDDPRGRPRGERGDRLLPLLRHRRAALASTMPHADGCRGDGRGVGRRRRAVELPVRDPDRAASPPPSPPGTASSSSRRPKRSSVGAWIADQFWRAGVPRDVLQLVVCDDGPVGRHLVTHPDVDTVVLTGAYETASMFLDWRPDLRRARRDERQGRAGHHAVGRHRPGDRRSRALGVRPRRPEVLGGQPRHRRRRRSTTTRRSSDGCATPSPACASASAADPATMVGPLIAAADGQARARPHRRSTPARRGWSSRRSLDTPGTTAGTSWSPGVRARREARDRGSTAPSASGPCSA